ncbi:hypothetical protein ZEAMMB73_Zm00001d041050 [Zea mays]|uniref:Uncharacterized protein n=1 Tax=Zea mays TaxID=4577 RepID=A0A1D6LZK4_MAIZE|nr:hypothetical protein ZEAMMB73_Zm00001d037646 [Zea mays]ONM32298.1 hypothetical protein ZEAMMB73_Zm00001d041050 [Zea mays]
MDVEPGLVLKLLLDGWLKLVLALTLLNSHASLQVESVSFCSPIKKCS